MVDEKELHHAAASLAHHRRIGLDDRRLAVRAGAKILHRDGAGGRRLWRAALHFDQAHAAVARDRQPLVEAEVRNFRAGGFASLKKQVFGRDFDFLAVDDDFAHAPFAP
jgi:hypothetical protein